MGVGEWFLAYESVIPQYKPLFILEGQKERYWIALPSLEGLISPKSLSRRENKCIDPKQSVKKTGCPHMKGKQFNLTIDMSPFPPPFLFMIAFRYMV